MSGATSEPPAAAHVPREDHGVERRAELSEAITRIRADQSAGALSSGDRTNMEGAVPFLRSVTRLSLAALVLFCATSGWDAVHAAQQGPATVRAVPPSSSVAKSNGTIDVKIDVENVNNLGGFQFVLVVDAAILRPTRALKTIFLGQSGREIYCPEPTIEDAAIRYACVTLREQPAGVDGAGTLATVSLKPVGKGTTNVTLKEVRLVHPDGTELASTTEDARISVTGGGWWTMTRILFVVAGGAAAALLIAVGGLIHTRRKKAGGMRPEWASDAEE